MSQVNILSDEVISKIAAGEIIERPASVVKEILENAIDAGSKKIEVHLKDAGKTLIHIKDNGQGIEQEDFEKIFLRHATSKIKKSEDLFSIYSLGFRGEALYGIAAVSDVLLRSKTKTQETGFEIHLQGGEIISLKPCTMEKHGTEIEIRELFFNTPARRKFLKSNTTELNQIINLLTNYALLHKEIALSLSHQEKTIIDLTPSPSFKKRTAETLKIKEEYILEASQDFSLEGNSKIQMLLGDINVTRARRDMQFIYVNGRPVANKNIAFHVNNSYKLILPAGSFPFYSVFLTIPAKNVDVNIHPTKREVKIKNEQDLCSIIRLLTQQTLMRKSQAKQINLPNPSPRSYSSAPQENIFMRTDPGDAPLESYPERKYDLSSKETYKRPKSFDIPSYPSGEKTIPESFFIPENRDEFFAPHQNNLQNKLQEAQYIGSFINKYLLFETQESLFFIDQHAAAERIAYENLIRQMEKGGVETQLLLTPVLIKLSPADLLIWEEVTEKLTEIGFASSLWDPDTIAIHSYPQLIKNIEMAIKQLLAGERISTCDTDAIARRACRSAVMSGDRLNKEQSLSLRAQLIKCLDPFTCPHGRPTVIELNETFLDKQFLRK